MVRFAILFCAVWSAVACAPAQGRMVVAAHRGLSSAAWPENSLAAFRHAVAQGTEVIEIDLRQTADGEIVVMHDPSVDRTSNAHGSVARMSLAQLKTLDLGGGEHVPTLSEVLAVVRGSSTRLLLDLKRGGDIPPGKVVGAIIGADAMDKILVGARSADAVRTYRKLAPTIEILGLIPSVRDVDAFAKAGAGAIRLWPKWLFGRSGGCGTGPNSECIVTKLQRRGLAVWTTANAPTDFERARRLYARLAQIGVDAVLTDRPELARAAVSASSD